MATSETILAACERGELELSLVLSELEKVVGAAIALVQLPLSTRFLWKKRRVLQPDCEFSAQDLVNLKKAIRYASGTQETDAERLDTVWPVFYFSWRLTQPGLFNPARSLTANGRTGRRRLSELVSAVKAFDVFLKANPV